MATFHRIAADHYNPTNTSADTVRRNLCAATLESDVDKLLTVATTFKQLRHVDTVEEGAYVPARGDIILRSGREGFVMVRDMAARELVPVQLSAKRVAAIVRKFQWKV